MEAIEGLTIRTAMPVLEVCFDRPAKKNAISLEMWKAIPRVLDEAVADPTVEVVVLRGAEGNFSAGADISEFGAVRSTPEQAAQYSRVVEAAEAAIANAPLPTIAVIEGYCLGGGLELALACDYRIAGESARASIPAAKVGIVYSPTSIRRLTASVGPSFAKYIMYTGSIVDVELARAHGLFDELHPDEELAAALARRVEEFAAGSNHTIAAAKLVIESIIQGTELDEAAIDEIREVAPGGAAYRAAIEKFAR